MLTREKHIVVTLCALLAVVAAGPSQAGIKCWTNSEGVKECGNVVPPEYAQKGHSELNEQGITTGTVDRAKTAEEIAEEKQALIDQAERDKLAEEQAARDRVLLDTFTTEEELKRAHDDKIAAIDTRIVHTRQIEAGLHDKLDALEEQAANQERAGKELDPELVANIEAVQTQLEENSMFIVERENEKDALRAQLESDLTRYRQLKGF